MDAACEGEDSGCEVAAVIKLSDEQIDELADGLEHLDHGELYATGMMALEMLKDRMGACPEKEAFASLLKQIDVLLST